jgi:hypothetical protein
LFGRSWAYGQHQHSAGRPGHWASRLAADRLIFSIATENSRIFVVAEEPKRSTHARLHTRLRNDHREVSRIHVCRVRKPLQSGEDHAAGPQKRRLRCAALLRSNIESNASGYRCIRRHSSRSTSHHSSSTDYLVICRQASARSMQSASATLETPLDSSKHIIAQLLCPVQGPLTQGFQLPASGLGWRYPQTMSKARRRLIRSLLTLNSAHNTGAVVLWYHQAPKS